MRNVPGLVFGVFIALVLSVAAFAVLKVMVAIAQIGAQLP